MSSRPDDWVFHKTQLIADCKIGKDKLNRVFKELINYGHICVTQTFDGGGKFSNNEYLFFADSLDNPAFISPCTEKPLTVKPSPVNPPLQSKEFIQKKDNTNTDGRKQPVRECFVSEGFEYWWSEYPTSRRINKKGCLTKFKSKCKGFDEDQVEDFVNKLCFDVKQKVKEIKDIQFMVTTMPYLNQERYNDE